MEEIDKRIVDFIKKHHLLSLACIYRDKPYCCSLFYVYNFTENEFYFTSDDNTIHAAAFKQHQFVSGTIAWETNIIGMIRGIQLLGTVEPVEPDLIKKVKMQYIKRFPVASVMDLNLWKLKPTFIKMTDNRLGFGKKLIWGSL